MSQDSGVLALRPGEWVEVRSKDEILATLSQKATLDALPFMPEMFVYCGQQFRVFKRADKTCDTIDKTGARRIHDTVHLDSLRCDGSAHGGCEARCLIFWKEAWLKRVSLQEREIGRGLGVAERKAECTRSDVEKAAVVDTTTGIYRCQVTQLKEFTQPLAWWDVRQYVRDVTTNGVRVVEVAKALLFAIYRKLVELGIGYRALMTFYDWFQSRRGGTPYPFRTGQCEKTPAAHLNLQPGELVRIKSFEAILATLDRNNRNRGLYFDGEMVKFCGRTYRVANRVHKILDERTGKMMEFPNPCIILQNVYCRADVSKHRLFCPRGIYPYWREIWLERANESHTL
jgi:hypothetical protein